MIQWTKVLIISGPSGVGKDTLLEGLLAELPRLRKVITCTTRQPRPGEIAGVHYTFLTPGQFEVMAEQGAFLEHKLVHDYWYATPYSQLREIQAEGGIPVMNIDVQGAAEVRAKHPEVRSVFILPPSMEVLEQRLRSRGLDSEEVMARRLENARMEIEQAKAYSYQLVNDDLRAGIDQLKKIVEELG